MDSPFNSQFSVTEVKPEDTIFSLSDDEQSPALVEPVLTRRSMKASIATGKPPIDLQTQLSSPDGEANLRRTLDMQDQIDQREEKLGMINEMVKQGGMTTEKADFVLALSQDEVKASDPNKLEQKYAENVLRLTYANADNANYLKAMEHDSEKTNSLQDGAEQILRTREVIRKTIEDSSSYADHSAYGTASHYLGTGWNMLEQLVPGKSDWAKYDQYAGSGWMPGSNMADQMHALWFLPPQEREAKFKQKFDEIAAHNPLDAQDWARSMLGMSNMDVTWSNAMTAVDVASTLPIGTAMKVMKGGAAVAKSVEGGVKLVSEADKAIQIDKSISGLGLQQARTLEEGITAKLKTRMFSRDNKELIAQRGQVRLHINNLDTSVSDGLKEAVSIISKENPDPVAILGRTGNVEGAVDLVIRENLSKIENGMDMGKELVTIRDRLAGVYNPEAWLSTSRNMSRELSDRITSSLAQTRSLLNKSALKPGAALRLTEEQLKVGVETTKQKMRSLYVNASDSIIDTRWGQVNQEDTVSQINSVVMSLGDTNALPFVSREDAIQAAEHAYMIPDKGYEVKPVGSKWVIEVTRSMDETDHSLVSVAIDTYSQTPKGVFNTLLGYVRSPEDLLSKRSRDNRNAVVPLAQETLRLLSDAITPAMKGLTKEQTNRLSRMMKVNRDIQEGDVRGKWFKDAAEYEQNYYDVYKEWPKEAEIRAFMTAREVSDFDWAVKSLTIHRDRLIQGLGNVIHKIKISGGLPSESGELSGFNSKIVKFVGKKLDELPSVDIKDNPGVILLRDNETAVEWNLLSDVNRTELDRLVKEEGYRIYQSESPTSRPYAEFTGGDQDASIYILRDANTSSLKVDEMLPYAAGGHVEYGQGFYTKTANLYHDKSGRRVYAGDTSLMYHVTEAQAKKYTEAYQKAVNLHAKGAGDKGVLEDFLRSNLPHTLEQFEDSLHRIDPTSPIFYVKNGQTTKEAARTHFGQHSKHFEGAVDLTESKYNLSSFVERKFVQEKNLALPSAVKGSEGNPIFNYNPSQKIDPLSTMQRAMHGMVRNLVYDNYQKQAISSLIEEFANPATLGGSVTKRNLDATRRNPMSFLLDPLWDTKGADRAKLAAAKNVHRSITQLLNTPSELSRNMDWINNKILDFTYNKFGDNAAEKVADFMHTKLKDPTKYARSIAFHTNLGLFNPVQIFIQGQSIIHAAAVTGNLGRSYKAGSAAALMRRLSLTDNPDIIHSFAKKAGKFGWGEDDFKEAFTVMRDTGVWNVEGDYAALDDLMSPKIFKGKISSALDKGTIFFKESERYIRLNAFNTAYLEWKQANKGAKLVGNQRAINSLLTRYDDLAMNMTSKSTSSLQKGIFSIPTQFATYNIHLAEQLLGKRLTGAEKARAIATYSVLYGLPAGLTAAVPLHPWGEDIKKAAMERGIDINDGAVDLMLNGVMSNAVEMATGKETNLSTRWGPGPVSFITDGLSGDKTILELLSGPSGQVSGEFLKNIFRMSAPVLHAVASGTPDDNVSYPLLFEDFVESTRTISSVNNAVKFYQAANQHKFMSKHEVFQTEADVYDGVLAGVFGLSPRSVGDAFLKNENMKAVTSFKREKALDVEKNIKRAIDNHEDIETFNRFMRAAKLDAVNSGMTGREFQSAMSNALRNSRLSLVNSINNKWVQKHPEGLQVPPPPKGVE